MDNVKEPDPNRLQSGAAHSAFPAIRRAHVTLPTREGEDATIDVEYRILFTTKFDHALEGVASAFNAAPASLNRLPKDDVSPMLASMRDLLAGFSGLYATMVAQKSAGKHHDSSGGGK